MLSSIISMVIGGVLTITGSIVTQIFIFRKEKTLKNEELKLKRIKFYAELVNVINSSCYDANEDSIIYIKPEKFNDIASKVIYENIDLLSKELLGDFFNYNEAFHRANAEEYESLGRDKLDEGQFSSMLEDFKNKLRNEIVNNK